MAGGHNANRMLVNNPNISNARLAKKATPERHQGAIDRHWKSMPVQAKTFLIETPAALSLHRLAWFWSKPSVLEYTQGSIAARACDTSWFIALNYLRLGRVPEARALTLNGAFLHQCCYIHIEDIVEVCGADFNVPVDDYEMPLFSRGFYSVRTPQTMEAYLQKSLPKESEHMMASFANISRGLMNYVGQIGDNWGSSSPTKAYHNPLAKTLQGTQIQMILQDDADKGERRTFNIGSWMTLKTLFNNYAEKRGVSLRSLRFSYGGKTLFLSSIGNKTPDELNMRDRDVITVYDTTASQGSSSSDSGRVGGRSTPKKIKKLKNNAKKTKGNGKNRRNREQETTKSLQEYKAQHSFIMSKLHNELESRLKEIRTRLNALDLDRQPPKLKKKGKRSKEVRVAPVVQVLPDAGVGGKAGKPYFSIQVGEVQNLYRTAKPSSSTVLSSWESPPRRMLDLHGCTKHEALARLESSRGEWADEAMLGSYPFVVSATVVCGCGSQVLSETVREWIRSTSGVCNAPKGSAIR